MKEIFRLQAEAQTTPPSVLMVHTTAPSSPELLAEYSAFYRRYLRLGVSVKLSLETAVGDSDSEAEKAWLAHFFAYLHRRPTLVEITGADTRGEPFLVQVNERFIPGLRAIRAINWCGNCNRYHPSTDELKLSLVAIKRALKCNQDPEWQPERPLAAEAHG